MFEFLPVPEIVCRQERGRECSEEFEFYSEASFVHGGGRVGWDSKVSRCLRATFSSCHCVVVVFKTSRIQAPDKRRLDRWGRAVQTRWLTLRRARQGQPAATIPGDGKANGLTNRTAFYRCSPLHLSYTMPPPSTSIISAKRSARFDAATATSP